MSTRDGGTPTAQALAKAGDDILRSGGTGVIVLVSDGESNCDIDPCDTAKELAAKGVDITVNTVGFKISEAGRTELQCIADATGGTYVDADDSTQLKDEFRGRAVADLRLKLDYPRSAMVRAGRNNTVEVRATIQNASPVGGPDAGDVQTTLTFDSGLSPGSSQPRRRLGNLAPQQNWSGVWRFRPTNELEGATLAFTVTVTARGVGAIHQKGRIVFRPPNNNDLPAWLTEADHIVVMGDSYSSGEGVQQVNGRGNVHYDHPTDEPFNSCHRSNRWNYGGQLARLLSTRPKVTTLACSGAVTADFWADSDSVPTSHHTIDGTQRGKTLPSQLRQLKSLADPPDLIILTIGGNDAGFESIIKSCLATVGCENGLVVLFNGREQLRDGIQRARTNLPSVYRSVERVARQRAGHDVPILVLPYPMVFPNQGQRCSVVDIYLGSNHGFLNRVVTEVNQAVADSVAQIRSEGDPVWVVEPVANVLQGGHTYCDRDPWINTLSTLGLLRNATEKYKNGRARLDNLLKFWGDDLTPAHRNESRSMAHPNVNGHRAEAELIIDWASANPDLRAPTTKDTHPPGTDRSIQMKSTGTVNLDKSGGIQLQAGELFVLQASGFAPGTPVSFHIESRPESLALVHADAEGVASAGVIIREDMPLGRHELVAKGVDPTGEPREVRKGTRVERSLPWWWWPAAGLALGLLLAGLMAAGATLIQRRRDPNRTRRPSPREPRSRRRFAVRSAVRTEAS